MVSQLTFMPSLFPDVDFTSIELGKYSGYIAI